MVLRAVEVVLVQDVVLGRSADHPDGTSGLGEDTAAGVDGDAALLGIVEVVVSVPNPGSLEVGGRLGGEVQREVRRVALLVLATRRAVVDLEAATLG